jgi:branched-chain amino acid transport system permease protein
MVVITSQLILEAILNGIISGSFYALVASGISLIWGTMHMVNFAHGEFYMIGSYILFFSLTRWRLNPVVGIILSAVIVFFLGVGVQRFLIHPMIGKPGWEHAPMILTLGVSIFTQQAAMLVWGERYKSIPYFVEGTIPIFGLSVAIQRFLILAVCSSVIVVLWIVLKKTKIGMAIRATSQNRDAAALMGINPFTMFTLAFGLSVSLAAIAGCMLAPLFLINPWMGHGPLLKSFVVCILGGLGSVEGAIIASFLLGTFESMGVILISSEWKDIIAFIIMLIILYIRPQGLLGIKERT